MIKLILFTLLIFPVFVFCQEDKPCIIYERPTYSTGPHPKTVPVFPGCETYIHNNDSLNYCIRNLIGTQIADKLDMQFLPDAKMDTALSYYKVTVLMDIDILGKLKMILKKKNEAVFENKLIEVLNEISRETTGIIPARS